jgi:hypothetical protein
VTTYRALLAAGGVADDRAGAAASK